MGTLIYNSLGVGTEHVQVYYMTLVVFSVDND